MLRRLPRGDLGFQTVMIVMRVSLVLARGGGDFGLGLVAAGGEGVLLLLLLAVVVVCRQAP